MKILDNLFNASPRSVSLRTEIIAATGLIGLGLLCRLATAGQDSLWVDEGYTLATSQIPAWQLWTIPMDVHPPLYYTLVKPFLAFEQSEFSLRLLSVLASTLALFPVYLLARWMLGNFGALTALAVTSLSFTHLVYANNGRNYALLLFLFFTLSAALYQVARHLTDTPTSNQRRLYSWAIVYVTVAIAALYTHNTSVFYIFWMNVACMAYVLITTPRRLFAMSGKIILLNMPVVVAWIPWLIVITSTSEDFSWLQQATPAEAVRTLLVVILPNRSTPLGVIIAVVALALGAIAALSRDRFLLVMIIFHVLILPLFMWSFGFIYKPVFMERVILPALLGSALMYGAAAAYFKPRGLAYLMTALVVAASAASTAAYIWRPADGTNLGGHSIQNWRDGVAGSLAGHERVALVLCSSFSYPTVSFYAGDADIYLLRPDGTLAFVDDDIWQHISSLPVAERNNDFHAALDALYTPGKRLVGDWSILAQTYDSVASLRTDMFCGPEFDEYARQRLSGAGFRPLDLRQYPGVVARSFVAPSG